MKSLSETVSDLRSTFGKIRIPVDEFNKKLAELEQSQASLDAQFEAGEIAESDYKARTKNIAEAQATLMDRAYGAEGALKAQYASMIAGKNALSGFMALVNSSDEDFEKLTAAINNSEGAAKEMAETMMDNLEGDLTKLSSAFEGFELTLYEKFTTPLRGIVQAVTNEVIPALTDLINGVDGAADRVGAALSDIVSNILDKLVDALPEVVDIVTSLISSLSVSLIDMAPKLVDIAAQIINKLIQSLGDLLKKLFDAVQNILPDLIDSLLGALPMFIDTLTTLARDLADALPDIIKDITDALPDTVKKIAAVISEQFDVLLSAAVDIFTALIEAIPEILPGLIDAVIDMVGSIGDALTNALPKVLDAAITLFEAIVDAIPKILPLIAKTLPDIINAIVKFFTKNAPTIAKAGVKLFIAILDALPVSSAHLLRRFLKLLTLSFTLCSITLPPSLTHLLRYSKRLKQP
jgi:phage-related protein